MQRDTLVSLMETLATENNGDRQKALNGFHKKMEEVIETQGVTLEHISIRNLAEAMCGSLPGTAVELAETITAAAMPVLTGKLLHGVFIAGYESLTNMVMPLVQEVTSTRSKETIGGLSAHDNLQLTREATPFQHSQPSEKYSEIANHKFGLIVDLTKEAVVEDRTGQIVATARDIGVKGGTHQHAYIIEKVTDVAITATGEAANTSLRINGSTRTMYANDHSSWDVQTNDNLAASSALGSTGLKTARTLLGLMKDEKGDPIIVIPRFLLVPVELEVTALEQMGSQQKPGTGNNEINAFRNAYTIISSPILDATLGTTWYLGDPSRQTRLQWYDRPRTDTMGASAQMAFNSDIVSQFKFHYHAGVGCTDYRYVVKATA